MNIQGLAFPDVITGYTPNNHLIIIEDRQGIDITKKYAVFEYDCKTQMALVSDRIIHEGKIGFTLSDAYLIKIDNPILKLKS